MNSINEILKKCQLNPKRYTIIKNVRIIETDQGKFLLKKKKRSDKFKIYQYLVSRGFTNFPKEYNDLERDEYEVYPYIEVVATPDEQKALDMIYLMSLLHNKTTFYKNIDLNDIKETYERLDKKISYLTYYYHDLQDIIEQHIFMSPSEYLLIRNMSKVYAALFYSKNELEHWYSIVSQKKKERYVMIHNNLSLEHILESESPYLISWDYAKIDSPIYDIIPFYKKYFHTLDFHHLMNIYEGKYPLLEEERILMNVLLSIPEKIELDKNVYENTLAIKNMITMMDDTNEWISKQQSANTN